MEISKGGASKIICPSTSCRRRLFLLSFFALLSPDSDKQSSSSFNFVTNFTKTSFAGPGLCPWVSPTARISDGIKSLDVSTSVRAPTNGNKISSAKYRPFRFTGCFNTLCTSSLMSKKEVAHFGCLELALSCSNLIESSNTGSTAPAIWRVALCQLVSATSNVSFARKLASVNVVSSWQGFRGNIVHAFCRTHRKPRKEVNRTTTFVAFIHKSMKRRANGPNKRQIPSGCCSVTTLVANISSGKVAQNPLRIDI
mmetsp:Transcript_1711/g.2539  ORF Transcript_1711/g.2539 Transcript_1711/m.2539 type:complete len:254 (+) Transcript_1711:268-1029(+)